MGREIEKVALERGHEIVVKYNLPEDWDNFGDKLKEADAAIEFSMPAVAVENIYKCFEADVPVIVGTTGWTDKAEEVKKYAEENNKAILFSSNFSIGVNVFFEINKRLASIMNKYDVYSAQVEEIHHTQKLDAPSGTAITIAEGMLDNLERKSDWVNESTDNDKELSIISKRIEDVPGTHIVEYDCHIDTIEIKHTAKNRVGFATGSVVAAEWIVGKTGFFSMNDVLNF